MSKSSEQYLGDLHGHIAKVMSAQVLEEEEVIEFDSEGVPVSTGALKYTASPALLAVAAKFLKDNNITSDIKVDRNMSGLAEALNKKQKHSRLGSGRDTALKVVCE